MAKKVMASFRVPAEVHGKFKIETIGCESMTAEIIRFMDTGMAQISEFDFRVIHKFMEDNYEEFLGTGTACGMGVNDCEWLMERVRKCG